MAVIKIKMLYAQSRRARGVEDKPGLPESKVLESIQSLMSERWCAEGHTPLG